MNQKLLTLKLPGTDQPIGFPTDSPNVTPGGLLSKADLSLADIISAGIRLTFFAVGLALFAYLLYGGFKFLTSLGDDAAIEEAKGTITNAILGFIIVFAAFFITRIFGSLFGITIF